MLSIQIPHIAIQKVSNGYVVQWSRKNYDAKSSERTKATYAIAATEAVLIDIISKATKDIEELT